MRRSCDRRSRLFPLAVEVQPEVEVLRIADLVCRDEPGAAGREGRVALSFRPLPFPLELVLAFRDVVQDAVAGDVAGRFLLGDVPRPLADDDRQLDLPVELGRTWGQDDIIIGAAERDRVLVEEDGLRRDRRIGLLRMVCVVQPDADEVGDAGNGYAETRALRDARQARKIEAPQAIEASWRDRRGIDVANDAAQVANLSVLVDGTGALCPTVPEAHKFHSRSPGVM